MNIKKYIFPITFYGLNYLAALYIWYVFNEYIYAINPIIFFFVATILIYSQFMYLKLSDERKVISDIFYYLSAIRLLIFYYVYTISPILLLVELILERKLRAYCYLALSIVFLLICIYGFYAKNKMNIKDYRVNLDNNSSSLKLAIISDVHVGPHFSFRAFQRLIEKINEIKPDYIFFCGDLIDEGSNSYYRDKLAKLINSFSSKNPFYGVLGNHDSVNSNRQFRGFYDKCKIILLEDQCINIKDNLLIVGRKDVSLISKKLNNITTCIDKKAISIVLDHQPGRVLESVENQVNIHISGHTHAGQFFPINILTKFLFKIDYGNKKVKATNAIVSSGLGGWNPPVRLGTKAEIVIVHIN